ncbi:MAG: type 1 glutamine amidotransferase domain-containing protein [Micavibrio aeruginosavorus]|nr:type 1 glutamine amidotransferase domain-containing protein [Micavibrio aeruginosavorus]
MRAKKILIVLTSHDRLGNTGEKTGVWLDEFATPYYVFKDAGAILTLASPKGGQPPLDPKSIMADSQTDATRRFNADREAQTVFANTKKLGDVRASDFDAVFYPGGHGPLWDLAVDQNSARLIEDFLAQNKPVSAVCHAPIVLMNAKDKSGAYIVADRNITGFSNSEEKAVGLTDAVPALVEDMLIRRGAKYSKAADFMAHVCIDGNLITGQNPASAEPVARQVLAMLDKRAMAA